MLLKTAPEGILFAAGQGGMTRMSRGKRNAALCIPCPVFAGKRAMLLEIASAERYSNK